MSTNKKNNKIKSSNSYMQYSGMAFQLFGILFIAMFIGMKVDKYIDNESYYFAAAFSFIALIAYLYKLVITLGPDKK